MPQAVRLEEAPINASSELRLPVESRKRALDGKPCNQVTASQISRIGGARVSTLISFLSCSGKSEASHLDRDRPHD